MFLQKTLVCILSILAIGTHGQAQQNNTLPKEETEQQKTQVLTFSEAIILGLVEGATEFLPVSSTGHLILVSEWLDIYPDDKQNHEALAQKQTINTFIIIIQLGAIAAVLSIYHQKVYIILLGLLGKSNEGLYLARNIILAFLPAALIGLSCKTYIDHYLFGSLPVITALFAGGVLMLFIDRWYKKRTRSFQEKNNHPTAFALHQLSIRQSLFIGLCQSAALWPGVSRSMATLIGGYLCGLSPKHAAQFSFLLGLPTLAAAAFYEGVRNGTTMVVELGWGAIFLGITVATISAMIAVKSMVAYLEKYGLPLFAWYRIILALVITVILFL